MKTALTCLLSVFIIGLSVPAYGQGYSSGAYSELKGKRTYVQRMSDWFATVGKTREQKALIMSQRQARRNLADKQKSIERKRREIERQKRKLNRN